MTSTLYFYKLPINLLDKNFILENLETYLATLTPVTKSSFQFQRFDMEKTIKVNISQDYQSYNGLTRYNYLKITQLNANNTTAIYYYFIKKPRQISESTIAFDLVMDTLNTFKYKTSFSGGQDYTLSDKSLITREHKDRWGGEYLTLGESASFKEKGSKLISPQLNRLIYIDKQALMQDTNLHSFTFGFTALPVSASVLFNIHVYNTHDGSYYDFGYDTRLPDPHFCCSQISFQYDGDDTIEVEVQEYKIVGGTPTLHTIVDEIVVSEEEWFIEIKSISPSLSNTYKTAFADMLNYINARYGNMQRMRIIDRFQEGIESITFKHSEEELNENGYSNDWYIAYSSANAVVQTPTTDTQPLYVNPVQVDFFCKEGYTITTQSASVVRITPTAIPQYSNVEEWLRIDLTQLEAGGYVEINGTQYTSSGFVIGGTTYYQLWVEKKNNNDLQFRRVYASSAGFLVAENVAYIDFYGLNSCEIYSGTIDSPNPNDKLQDFYIGSGSSSITGTSPAFNAIDLTDPKLIKIINLPYAPREDLAFLDDGSISSELVWNASLNCLELKNAQVNGFNRNITFENTPFKELSKDEQEFIDLTNRMARNESYESKLFHSDFYLPKFVYDSFTFGFRLEDININEYKDRASASEFIVHYVCSGNVQSKFMFQFPQYVCDREFQDYNNVLLVDRNNEKAIFNNAYINYIRSGGFRYDTKNADMQKMMNGITIPLAGLASGAGVGAMLGASSAPGPLKIAGAVVGAVVGMASRTISAIHSAQQNDRQIAQKLLSASQQSTSVSTSEDIDILKAYSNNKAKLCFYEVSSYLKNALWDLFHYFGYRCNEYKIPQTNTRCNFNFIQGDIVLKDFTFNDDVARDIISKWADGVTFMHYDNSLGYDFNQEYENFETSLL